MKLLLRGFFMAQSLPSVKLESKEWVDLYDATGIVVGTQIIIQNIGDSNVRLVEAASQPSLNGGYNLVVGKNYSTSATAPIGAWAYSHEGTLLQVEEA